MSLNNPYIGRGEPVSGSRLVGRNHILERLSKRVSSGAHCSIVGLPRIGKTSVARETLKIVCSLNSNIKTGYVTLDAISGPIQAYKRIISEISDDDFNDQSLMNCITHDDTYEALLKFLRKRNRSGHKAAVIIDEVDGIARDSFLDSQLFVSRLRELANDRDRYGVTFIFLSRRSLDMIQGVVDCSTLAGLCEVTYLQPLDREAIDQLTSRSPIKIEANSINALWNFTGGHPFLSEVVMCEAVEIAKSFIDVETVENAQHLQSHEFTNYYCQIQNIFTSNNMFDALCELIVGPRWRTIDFHTIILLKHYGLIKAYDDSDNSRLKCMSQHLEEYLKLISRTTPSWYLLGETERQLRILIQDKMQEAFGDDWLESIKQRHPKKEKSLDNLIQQKQRENKIFGDAASDFILDYAYIGELKDLLFAEWDNFRSILGNTKGDWEKMFQALMKVRNPMAHYRPIPSEKLLEAEIACKSLLAKLTGTSKYSNDNFSALKTSPSASPNSNSTSLHCHR